MLLSFIRMDEFPVDSRVTLESILSKELHIHKQKDNSNKFIFYFTYPTVSRHSGFYIFLTVLHKKLVLKSAADFFSL